MTEENYCKVKFEVKEEPTDKVEMELKIEDSKACRDLISAGNLSEHVSTEHLKQSE